MNCDECRENLIPLLKKELENGHEMDAHLAACPDCAAEAEATKRMLGLLEDSERPSIREMVNRICVKAIQEEVTEIHFTPRAKDVLVRFRREGVLAPKLCYERQAHEVRGAMGLRPDALGLEHLELVR